MSDTRMVHECDWASQPNIRIKCTGVMTTPAWEGEFCKLCHKKVAYRGALFCGAACSARWEARERPQADVYVTEAGQLYTFREELVTCPICNGGTMNDLEVDPNRATLQPGTESGDGRGTQREGARGPKGQGDPG